jgi:hypothetical protein
MGSPGLKTFSLFILAILLSCGRPKAVEKIECADRDPKTGMPFSDRRTFQMSFEQSLTLFEDLLHSLSITD